MKQTYATILKLSYLSIIVGLYVTALQLQGANWKEGFNRICAVPFQQSKLTRCDISSLSRDLRNKKILGGVKPQITSDIL